MNPSNLNDLSVTCMQDFIPEEVMDKWYSATKKT